MKYSFDIDPKDIGQDLNKSITIASEVARENDGTLQVRWKKGRIYSINVFLDRVRDYVTNKKKRKVN